MSNRRRLLLAGRIPKAMSNRSFHLPPPRPSRRVVVTGLGLVTPLGCGVETTWRRLVEGECGIRQLTLYDLNMGRFHNDVVSYTFEQLSSKVAGVVACGSGDGHFDESLWLKSKDHRSIARFIAYALCAAEVALRDACWLTIDPQEKKDTVISGTHPLMLANLNALLSYHPILKWDY